MCRLHDQLPGQRFAASPFVYQAARHAPCTLIDDLQPVGWRAVPMNQMDDEPDGSGTREA